TRKVSRSNTVQNDLIGEWNLLHSENFDKCLEKLGVETTHREIAHLQSTTLTISQQDNQWTIFAEGAYAIHKTIFEIGKPTQSVRTVDGRIVTSTWTIDRNGKLLKREKNEATGVEMECEMYVKNEILIQKMKCSGVKSRRTYAKSHVCTLRRLSSVF
ncbi:hypothetical protein PENTCL1PPCAC_27125, partial [Pristionchus entomophagus]